MAQLDFWYLGWIIYDLYKMHHQNFGHLYIGKPGAIFDISPDSNCLQCRTCPQNVIHFWSWHLKNLWLCLFMHLIYCKVTKKLVQWLRHFRNSSDRHRNSMTVGLKFQEVLYFLDFLHWGLSLETQAIDLQEKWTKLSQNNSSNRWIFIFTIEWQLMIC